jgi:hypothetical protein
MGAITDKGSLTEMGGFRKMGGFSEIQPTGEEDHKIEARRAEVAALTNISNIEKDDKR